MNADWFLAAEQGLTDVIVDLLDGGADVNARGEYRITALMLAVSGRHIATIEALLSRGADPNAGAPVDWSAMTWAALQARGLEVVQGRCWPTLQPDSRPLEVLTAAGGQLGLREAIVLGDVELARRICDSDDSIDINGEAQFGMHETYLMLAAQFGHLAIANFLIEWGADIEGIDDLHHTALIRASEMGQLCIVDLLLDRGADVNRGWPSQTALSYAQLYGHQAVAKQLLLRGAKRNLRDAIDLDDLSLAEELLKGGANPDDFGSPPVEPGTFVRHATHAVAQGNVKMVQLLLDHGASRDTSWGDDHTLLAEAARRGHVEMVRLLIAYGADLHAVGQIGRTALDLASEQGQGQAVNELKRAGALR